MSDLRSILIFLFLLPGISVGQTTHAEKDDIIYKGKIALPGLGKEAIYKRARAMLLNEVNGIPDSLQEMQEKNELSTSGSVRIASPHYLVKVFTYKVKLRPDEDGIQYEIGDIELKTGKRGRKLKTISSAQLLKGMEESGKVATETEKQLNAIDMHIQKLIALMRT